MINELGIKKPISDFVEAVNQHNTDDFLSAFTENAVISDEGNQYQGILAIKEWNAEKNIGAEITLRPIAITERDGRTILTAEVDGNFDKTGLADPFLMDLHFTHDETLISTLEYRLAGK
jgi:hypothetical protein